MSQALESVHQVIAVAGPLIEKDEHARPQHTRESPQYGW